jgi:hypothetical protein
MMEINPKLAARNHLKTCGKSDPGSIKAYQILEEVCKRQNLDPSEVLKEVIIENNLPMPFIGKPCR